MKFNLVELCVDLRTYDLHFCLRRITPRFKLRFNRVIANRYGSSSAGYSDLFGDANMIQGCRKAGEFYKIYEKTNRRVRLECTMAISALSHRRGGRVFRDEDDFRTMLAAMSAQVAPEFNHILRDERSEFDDHGSPAELISLLNPILRRHHPAEVQRVYEALMRHGRLTPTELSGASLQRLVQAGVLHHSARGIYIIARAMRALFARLALWTAAGKGR